MGVVFYALDNPVWWMVVAEAATAHALPTPVRTSEMLQLEPERVRRWTFPCSFATY
jgi:hypothetical protein